MMTNKCNQEANDKTWRHTKLKQKWYNNKTENTQNLIRTKSSNRRTRIQASFQLSAKTLVCGQLMPMFVDETNLEHDQRRGDDEQSYNEANNKR